MNHLPPCPLSKLTLCILPPLVSCQCGDPSHWGKDCPNNDGGGVRGYGGGGAGKRKWDGGGGGGYGKGW